MMPFLNDRLISVGIVFVGLLFLGGFFAWGIMKFSRYLDIRREKVRRLAREASRVSKEENDRSLEPFIQSPAPVLTEQEMAEGWKLEPCGKRMIKVLHNERTARILTQRK